MILIAALSLAAQSGDEFRMHALVPLGTEEFLVGPERRTLYLLASAESPEFEGWHVVEKHERRRLLDAKGDPVRFFPSELSFRVTATASHPGMLEIRDPLRLQVNAPISEYLLNLKFRVKIFRGLRSTAFEPATVKLIGVPADVPSEDRVYRVAFQLPRVPVQDRIVLEVLSPEEERICKFHLDLD